MATTLLEFYEESKQYVKLFDAFAEKHNLSKRARADHLCYKCSSTDSFENLRAVFEEHSVFMYQAVISGRRIAYIKMKEGILTSLGVIWFLELSDQKPDHSQKEGFDHIEVYPLLWSYEQMVREFQKTESVVHVERPHHTTDDIDIGKNFLFRCTKTPLLEKIKSSEML